MAQSLGVDAWLTIAAIVTLFVLLSTTKLPSELVFGGCVVFLLVTGVLPAGKAMSEFSSASVVMVGVLFVVVAGLAYSGVLQWLVRHVLGVPHTWTAAVVRLMLVVGALSSFLTNTTVVAMFVRVAKLWAKKLGISPSRLLIPLSYASCLGGICTLIGTPPNLIISGLYAERSGEEMNIFITTLPGLFCLTVGVLSVLAMHKLLPSRQKSGNPFQSTGEYTVELLVPADSPVVGKTVAEAGLSHMRGGTLFEIVRFDKQTISPIADDEYIMGNDRLIFSGYVDDILDLCRTHRLVRADHPIFSYSDMERNRTLRVGTLVPGSALCGRRMSDTTFESDHNVVLVAVSRTGERIAGPTHDITLHAGDVLLLETSGKRAAKMEKDLNGDLAFFDSEEIVNIGRSTVFASLIMIAMVALSSFGVMPMHHACFLAAVAMLVCRCCTPRQAAQSIDWPVLMVFAGSVCVGVAIETTGLAALLAGAIRTMVGSYALLALILICLVATFTTEFISNTAAGAIFFPLAYNTAESLGANPVTFCVALMIAVSCSFATPIGSPTHMLVYGEGGYRFSDFAKIGLPMNLILLAANIFIVTLLFPL